MTSQRFGVLRGMLQLAIWRRAGIQAFTGNKQAFLNSLAPLLAMPVVGFLLLAVQGRLLDAVSNLLLAVVILLAPVAASHLVAKWWRREGLWLRFAVALNWCQWVITAVAMLMMAAAGVAVQAGVPQQIALLVLLVGCLGYAISLQVFLAHIGLAMSRARAIGFVLLFNLAAAVLVLVPALVRMMVYGMAETQTL